MLSADNAWRGALTTAFFGDRIGPRGMDTNEVLGHQTKWDMNRPVVLNPARKLNYRFMAAEAYWITSGSPLVEDIAPYCKHISQFSDDGYIFNGAYGPLIESQTNFVVNTLARDRSSRQAVLTIWTPNPTRSKDHRCTVSMQFIVRDDTLHLMVYMRSSDVWLGLPYDMFNFSMVALKVACLLTEETGRPCVLGSGMITAGSLHIYTRDILASQAIKPYDNDVRLDYMFDWQDNVKWILKARETGDIYEACNS